MLTGLMLPIGLVVACVFLFIVLLSGKKSPAQAPAPSFSMDRFVERAPEPRMTAREQDRNVQAELAAKYYAEAIDERFKQDTLSDLANLLAARKA